MTVLDYLTFFSLFFFFDRTPTLTPSCKRLFGACGRTWGRTARGLYSHTYIHSHIHIYTHYIHLIHTYIHT